MDFKNKNLLIISSGYPDEVGSLIRSKFVKSQVDCLKTYFKHIYIISPLLYHRKFTEIGKKTYNYQYDNVSVYFPYTYYLPLSYTKKLHIDGRLRAVKHIIEKEHITFDIIHAHMSEPSGYIAMKLKEKYGVPYVLTIHENSGWFEKEIKQEQPAIINAWKHADALIRVNPYDVPVLKKYNENSYYIANGYSPSFRPLDKNVCREKLGVLRDVKILFGLGILTERKGFHYLIEAMVLLHVQHPDLQCYIGGGGPEYENLNKLIKKNNLDENVHLLGRLSDEEIPLWMNACDVFVLPSQGEGNPTVMFEALGCGKPFIGTRVGGIPAIISSDEYGLICEPGNVSSLREALEKALVIEWDSHKILEYAQQFMWENICEKIISIYKKIT